MTSLVCDRATGVVTFNGARLRLPTLREWTDWLDEHTVNASPLATFDPKAASLNRRIVETLGSPVILPAGDSMLPLGDSMLTEALLGFWRRNPLDPWMPHTPETATRDGKKRRPIRTELTGGIGMRAVLYRALVQIATPREVDAMELSQIAMLLGVDDPDRDLDPDEESEEITDSGRGVGPGARIVRSKDRSVSRMSFKRHPSQPYLFSEPGAIHRRRRRTR